MTEKKDLCSSRTRLFAGFDFQGIARDLDTCRNEGGFEDEF